MPVNTPYIGMPSRETTDFTSAVSVGGDSDFSGDINQRNAASAVTFASNDVDFTGTGVQISAAGSTVSLAGAVISTGTIDMNAAAPATGGVFLSKFTSASETSVTLADGEFGVYSLSVTSCVLAFRSGNTTYQVIADAASVL